MMIYTAHSRYDGPAEMVIVAEDPSTARKVALKVGKKRFHIKNLGVGTYQITKRACYRVR